MATKEPVIVNRYNSFEEADAAIRHFLDNIPNSTYTLAMPQEGDNKEYILRIYQWPEDE